MFMSENVKKISLGILILAVVAVITFGAWYIFNEEEYIETNQPTTPTLEIEERIPNLPPAAEEPPEVYSYTGQIKDIGFNSIILVTSSGTKTISYDDSTTILKQQNEFDPSTPPSAEDIAASKIEASRADLKVGSTIKITSLTNIRELGNFTASTIIIID